MISKTVTVVMVMVALSAAQRFDKAPWRRPPAQEESSDSADTLPIRAPPPPITSSSVCERKFARLPVPGQCDAYVECRNFVAYEMICPDGLHFNPEAAMTAYPCGYPLDVPCRERAGLQAAQPTSECPHRYGYFPSGDPLACGSYRACVDGHAYSMRCAAGLAWNQAAYKCDWPDQVPECNAEAFLGFTCPPATLDSNGNIIIIDRFYSHPENCQLYFNCAYDKPRLLRCDEGLAFDQTLGRCVDIDTVSTCIRR